MTVTSATVEEMFALKSLIAKLGSPNIDCRQDGSKLHPKFGRASYLFNSTIAGIEQADAVLIVGSNPRHEAPVLNARIRKRWLRGGALIDVVGARADLTYDYNYLGAGPQTLAQTWGKLPEGVAKPMMIVGAGAFARPDGVAVLARIAKVALAAGAVKDGWNGFNVLHSAASRVGGLDLALVPGEGGLDAPAMAEGNALDVLINLGADEIDIERGAFVVYVGTHGDRGAHRADVILQGAAYPREERNLRQHGRTAAALRAGGVSARRRARRLVDPARSIGPAGRQAAVQFACPSAAALAVSYPFLVRLHSVAPERDAGVQLDRRARPRCRQDAVRPCGLRFLFYQPDRARLSRHGRMFGFGAGGVASGGGIGKIR